MSDIANARHVNTDLNQFATSVLVTEGSFSGAVARESVLQPGDYGIIIRADGTHCVVMPDLKESEKPNSATNDNDPFATHLINVKKLTALSVALVEDQIMAVLLNLAEEIGAIRNKNSV